MIYIPKMYSQKDAYWAKSKIGNSENTFEDFGCLATNLCVIARYFGNDLNPKEFNEKMKEIGGFDNEGNYRWGAMKKLFPNITEKYKRTEKKLTVEEIEEIKNAINNKFPVIIWIDYNPRTVKSDMHWVIILDYNKEDENDFLIADPIDGQMRSLKKYLRLFKPSARKSIETFVIYEGKLDKNETEKIIRENETLKNKINEAIKILNN